MPDSTPKTVPLTPPAKNPNNIEAKKYFVFNETGNIMMASTVDTSTPLSEDVQKVFAEVSVFFAGMSRAITTTNNPATGKPYSLYNYEALERVIAGSGLFVHVTEQDLEYKTKSVGVDFSRELLQALLGLATGGTALNFASAMISSIGGEGMSISGSTEGSRGKVGNIVFVCEYLLGMPMVSAIVVYADLKDNAQQLEIGPCFKEQSTSTKWILHKDTYTFVTPSFIKTYADDLESINSDPSYMQMINWLSGLVGQSPMINGVADTQEPPNLINSGALEQGKTYNINGQFLPTEGSLAFASGTGVVNAGTRTPNQINFTVSGEQTEPSAIVVKDSSGNIVAQTPGTYTIAE